MFDEEYPTLTDEYVASDPRRSTGDVKVEASEFVCNTSNWCLA